MKEFFEKVDFGKQISRPPKSMQNYPVSKWLQVKMSQDCAIYPTVRTSDKLLSCLLECVLKLLKYLHAVVCGIFFSKLTLSKNSFRNNISVKQFESRLGRTFCQN